MSAISHTLLMQRIRNGIIRYLEGVSDPQVQSFLAPREVIEMWEDWVQEPLDRYALRVFTANESIALQQVHRDWLELVRETPDSILSYNDLYAAQVWPQFFESCREGHRTFLHRGRLSEDVELP